MTNVASCEPRRDLTWRAAQRPNAADAPLELTSATNTPSMTRNTKIPAFSDNAGTSPVVRASSSVPPAGMNEPLMMVFTVSMGSNPASSRAPTTMPMNSEL